MLYREKKPQFFSHGLEVRRCPLDERVFRPGLCHTVDHGHGFPQVAVFQVQRHVYAIEFRLVVGRCVNNIIVHGKIRNGDIKERRDLIVAGIEHFEITELVGEKVIRLWKMDLFVDHGTIHDVEDATCIKKPGFQWMILWRDHKEITDTSNINLLDWIVSSTG